MNKLLNIYFTQLHKKAADILKDPVVKWQFDDAGKAYLPGDSFRQPYKSKGTLEKERFNKDLAAWEKQKNEEKMPWFDPHWSPFASRLHWYSPILDSPVVDWKFDDAGRAYLPGDGFREPLPPKPDERNYDTYPKEEQQKNWDRGEKRWRQVRNILANRWEASQERGMKPQEALMALRAFEDLRGPASKEALSRVRSAQERTRLASIKEQRMRELENYIESGELSKPVVSRRPLRLTSYDARSGTTKSTLLAKKR